MVGLPIPTGGMREIADNTYFTGRYYTDNNVRYPIYVKYVDFGRLPNASRKTVAHGISLLRRVLDANIIVQSEQELGSDASKWATTGFTKENIVKYFYVKYNDIIIDTDVDQSHTYGYVKIEYITY